MNDSYVKAGASANLGAGLESAIHVGLSPSVDRQLEQAARFYIRRGFAPVPVPAGQKGPCIKGWQHLRLRDKDVPKAFAGTGNLGLILGSASGDLVDVDLDCAEARELADRILPPTAGVTGRPSSPRSHRWYICSGLQTVRHRDPVTHASIVELRGTGSQTLVGPSIHPSGEAYDFLEGDPAKVELAPLREAVAQLAAEVIRLRHGSFQCSPGPSVVPSHPLVAVGGDRARLLRRASAYLGALPPAISGQGGHNTAYTAATALVHGFVLSQEEALELLRTQFNPRCQPPWSDKELLHKVTDAAKRPHDREQGWLLSQG